MKDSRPPWVKPNSQQCRKHIPLRLRKRLRVLRERERVPSDDREDEFVVWAGIFLQFHPVLQGAEVVAYLFCVDKM